MRELTSHKVNPANDKLSVMALDQPGSGGACHSYQIFGYDPSNNPSITATPATFPAPCVILFQNGPISEVGVNGVTHEALLAILIDRLESFQAGPFANSYNENALGSLKAAQGWLFDRTRSRMERGVEGTHTV